MSYMAKVLKVMIATPGDVAAERNAIRQALADWNNAHSEARKIVLMPVGWDTHSSPEMGERAQALINKQVLAGCDILVGAFWTRAGTPTGEHASGAIEEIEEYLKQHTQAMLYFSSAPVVLDSVDANQYAQLKEFKDSCKSRGLFASYVDLGDFTRQFYHHLQIKLNSAEFGASASQALDGEIAAPPAIDLSKEAKMLLKGAAESDGQIMSLRHMGGTSIGYGGLSLTDGADVRSVARWESAVREIESKGLATPNAARNNFRLNSKGFDLAEILTI